MIPKFADKNVSRSNSNLRKQTLLNKLWGAATINGGNCSLKANTSTVKIMPAYVRFQDHLMIAVSSLPPPPPSCPPISNS
ncbi:hypothetical protein CEXT_673311 [Caerostris extrusa]|uniref:Uncharacterized protein n=1 Tax=Caerostris extrusa TaxID=172846 RepID=A0AAV4Y4L7_CAEEX|nr:hypothetical protein CEXT_673311 [Caerostris extrusa]